MRSEENGKHTVFDFLQGCLYVIKDHVLCEALATKNVRSLRLSNERLSRANEPGLLRIYRKNLPVAFHPYLKVVAKLIRMCAFRDFWTICTSAEDQS